MLRSIVLSTAGLLALAACTPQPAPTAPLQVLASARATTLVLSLDTVATPGGTASYTVVGTSPGENVHFVRAFGTGTGPCPGVLGGGCLDLDPASVVLMGSAPADAAGVATFDVPIPASAPVGATLVVQAVAVRGIAGVDSVKSPALDVQLVNASDLDGDGFLDTVDCDDSDPTVHPGAVEICDGRDNDCDGATSEDGLVSHSGVNYSTISDALFFAPTGETVLVCPGTYPEAIELTREVTLVGVGGSAVTVLDGALASTDGMTISAEADVEGFTVRDFPGSGVMAGTGPAVTLTDMVITGNLSGGIESWVELRVEDSVISGNSALFGGAVYTGFRHADLVNVVMTDNVASGGGAVFVDTGSTATITDSVFHNNEATGLFECGGAVMVWGTTVVNNSDFGIGATENLPDDVCIESNVFYATFQDDESFTCEPLTNNCL